MGDEKRHVDHLEEAARKAEADLRDDLEKAVEFEKADVAETHREWHDQLHNDHAELVADVARDKEEIREALDDARHPERIVHAAEEKLAHAADEARDVVRAVEHPSVIVDDDKEALAEKKHALDETAATIAAEFASPADKKRLPVVLRVFGVLLIIGSGVALPVIAKTMYQAVTMFDAGAMRGEGISTIVVTFVNLAVLVALAVTLIVFGVRLIRNQRRWAALLSYGLYVLLLAGALCSIMLAGIGYELIPYGVGFAVTVALQSYLDPSLLEERRAHRKAREAEEHAEGEAGTLGRDPSGKGYITLNFFNLFWIFVVASVLGLLMEEIVHFLFVVPGQWQDRAGLLFGPGTGAEALSAVLPYLTGADGGILHAVGTVLVVLVSLLLAYLTLSVVAGIAGACCSNMEDVGSANGAVLLIVMGGYLVSCVVGVVPSHGLAVFASLCPILSLFCAPVQWAAGNVPLAVLLASWALQLIVIAALMLLCARVYRELIVHRGSRVKLKQLLKMAKGGAQA